MEERSTIVKIKREGYSIKKRVNNYFTNHIPFVHLAILWNGEVDVTDSLDEGFEGDIERGKLMSSVLSYKLMKMKRTERRDVNLKGEWGSKPNKKGNNHENSYIYILNL